MVRVRTSAFYLFITFDHTGIQSYYVFSHFLCDDCLDYQMVCMLFVRYEWLRFVHAFTMPLDRFKY